MSATDFKIGYEQESSIANLDAEAMRYIGVFEANLAEGKLEEAKQAGYRLEAIEQRRAELGELDTMRKRVAEQRNRVNTPAQPHQHAAPQQVDEGGRRWKVPTKSPGREFTEQQLYRDLKAGGYFSENSIIPNMSLPLDYSLLSLKTLVVGYSVSSAGSMIMNDFLSGVVDMLQRPRTFLDLLSRVRTSSDTIDWVKQTAFTNAAATVAEATSTTGTDGTKPESALDWVRTTLPVQTIATWIPITTRALADAPMMQDIINGQIMTMLDLALETQCLTGGGTGSDLTGIINQGILTQALGADNTLDAVLKASVKIQISGLVNPTDVVMNPINFQTVRLLRENAATGTLGGYIMGPPSQVGAATIFGLPVTISQGLTANSVLVGAFNPSTHALFDREQANIRTGYVDKQFIRNMLTILGELRAAFVVTRPYAFAVITGVS